MGTFPLAGVRQGSLLIFGHDSRGAFVIGVVDDAKWPVKTRGWHAVTRFGGGFIAHETRDARLVEERLEQPHSRTVNVGVNVFHDAIYFPSIARPLPNIFLGLLDDSRGQVAGRAGFVPLQRFQMVAPRIVCRKPFARDRAGNQQRARSAKNPA